MNECANAACDDATTAFVQALTGSGTLFGCDMMDVLYKGDVSKGFYQGWRDDVTPKGGYLLTLVNMGIVVTTANLIL